MTIADYNSRLEHFVEEEQQSSPSAVQPLGYVVSVGGSHVMVQFASETAMGRTAQENGIQSDASQAEVTVGTFLGIWNGRSLVIGSLCDISLDQQAQDQWSAPATGRVDLLGEIVADQSGSPCFQRGVRAYPRIGNAVVAISHNELRIMFDTTGPNTIDIGHLQQDASVGAHVDVDDMVRKHFAIFGSTGAGKSSAVALILREIMDARQDLRILLIDPHNEYGACFEDRAHVVRPGNLRLPYWLFSFDEITEVVFGRHTDVEDEVGLLAELIPLAKNEYAKRAAVTPSYKAAEPEGGRYTVDNPVPYRMEDLIALAESRMGKLENSAVSGQYKRLLMRLHSVRKNPRYSFIFDHADIGSDNMVDILCELLRLEADGQPMSIVQLAGFPAEVFDAIVSVLFRLSFEFGLWSDGAHPLLIVCEEVHNYANADRSIGFRPAREAVSRIAKEGRKYGVFLGLVTQRPAQLDPTLISQCSTVFAMRMANLEDQRIVHAAVSDPANRLLGFLPSLGTREALAFGAGVPVATRLRFKQLPDAYIPRSEAVWGRRVDSGAGVDRALVSSVVARWRGIAMSNKPVAPAKPDAMTFALDGVAGWLQPDPRK
jgi:DNA helicase HerA-like ATPase